MLNVKKTIVCKQVKNFKLNRKIIKTHRPKAGDVGIFEVFEIGKHDSIQGTNGNNSYIFLGDLIMSPFGNRYATEQFEGYVPRRPHKAYDILGKGGAIGVMTSMHEKWKYIRTTRVKLIGFASDPLTGRVINTKYLGIQKISFQPDKKRTFKIFLSIGSSMDSGKTTTAAFLCRGINLSGKKVIYIKLTGTVYAKDRHFVRDCGADYTFDFSTIGFPSTYMCNLPELLNLYETLLSKAAAKNPDVVVIEIADGLLQRETKMLLSSRKFMKTVSAIIFSTGDPMSVLRGVSTLKRYGLTPRIVSGLLTASPLLVKEVKSNYFGKVLTKEELSTPAVLKHTFNGQLF